jgi:hypothetical protein
LILVFLVLAFFDFLLLSCHFWPFTDVLRKTFEFLTPEILDFCTQRGSAYAKATA